MKTKRITYLAAALALVGAATSCEQNDIYQKPDFAVGLSASNTLLAGDPVRFDFSGNPDFITVWNGDTGHEYQHRDRTHVALEDIESCELEIRINQQYGDGNAAVNNLEILAGNRFGGLDGSDATADRASVAKIADDGYADWTKLPFTSNRNRVWETYTYDIASQADNFSLGFHFHHDPLKAMRTYWLEPKITVKFRGYDTQVYKYSDFKFGTFSTVARHENDPYVRNKSGNGYIKLQGEPGSNSSAPIVFLGFNAGAAEAPIDQWAFTQPVALNTIAPDTGLNIKGVADDVRNYEYAYDKPGTYTATFIVSSGNYMGQSGQIVREVTFTVAEKTGR